jgi:hypothetical protein
VVIRRIPEKGAWIHDAVQPVYQSDNQESKRKYHWQAEYQQIRDWMPD